MGSGAGDKDAQKKLNESLRLVREVVGSKTGPSPDEARLAEAGRRLALAFARIKDPARQEELVELAERYAAES